VAQAFLDVRRQRRARLRLRCGALGRLLRRDRPYLKSERARGHAERLHACEQIRAEERELLGPRGGRDVQREHAATQPPGLRARGDAIADRAPPSFAIDHDPSRSRAHVACLFEQRADGRGRAGGRLLRRHERTLPGRRPAWRFGQGLTMNCFSPRSKKPTIWRAAASPAFTLASSVCAPCFTDVMKVRFSNFSLSAAAVASLGAMSEM